MAGENSHLKEAEKYMKDLFQKANEKEKKYDQLQPETAELDTKESSSRDARKMYGDVTPGDTTHQDVILLKYDQLQPETAELDTKESSSRDARKMYDDVTPGDTTHQDVILLVYPLKFRQKISEKEYQINQLNRIQKAGEIPQSILERRKVMKAESIKWLYDRCISIIEENLKAQLKNVCQCSTSVDSGEMVAFKVYGLLLSACQQETIVEKVTKSVEDENILGKNESSKEVAKVYVKQAVNVTYSMLTLLPPLIVTVHPREYSEVLHDTNRLTWDESTERIDELIYYRPILMYGNHLNVAVKGLVGNSKRELLQRSQLFCKRHLKICKVS
uniref:Uncharacterized protein n=1 Tax=Amphimedon queenslandica TaxID=400682 RepID=A0A1X7TS73_AMPQE